MVCANRPHGRGLFGTLAALASRLVSRKPDARDTAAVRAIIASAAYGAAEELEARTLLSSYYVSTSGNDSSPGTVGSPFKTIQRAANIAQPGDTVLVRGGTYHETVKPSRSGTSSSRIVFKPYNDESVTISGADPINNWTGYNSSIDQASMDWDLGFGNNQVFVDGQMMIEARWPNTSLDIVHQTKASADSISAGSSTATLSDGPLGSGWDGATIHIEPGQGWVAQTGKVTSSSGGKLTFSYTKMSSYEVPSAGDTYYLTGKFQALDAPGEWYFDSGQKKLFLRTPDGSSPEGHVQVKHRQYGFDLKDKKYIDVEGFNLFACTIVSNPNSGSLHLLDLNARYISQFVTMTNGWDRPHNTGLYVDGSDNLVEGCTVTYSAGHGIVLAGKNSRAENNVVIGAGYNGGDDAGIRTAGSGHVVTHNTIYNAGRDGMKISNTSNVKVTYNLIHDVMLQTTDGGGIYTWGSGGSGEIAYNRIYNVKAGGFGATGVFLDNYSQNWAVHHNIISNTNHALKMNIPSKSNKVYNNTLDGTDDSIGATKSNGDMSGSSFYNNIFTKKTLIGTGTSSANNLSSSTDPKFADRSTYQLQSSSPAVNAGKTISPYTNGSVGTPDIGALEYGKSRFTYGASHGAAASDPPEPTPTPSPTPSPSPTPTPSPSPVPTPSGATRNAKAPIQAEDYDDMRGVTRGSTVVGYLDSGDWLKYSNVDFGSSGVDAFIAVWSVPAQYAGKKLEIRTGSPTGSLLGTMTIESTGGWDTYKTQSIKIAHTTGVKNLYLVVRGGGGAGNLESFTFA